MLVGDKVSKRLSLIVVDNTIRGIELEEKIWNFNLDKLNLAWLPDTI
jgi:hypothetical protein